MIIIDILLLAVSISLALIGTISVINAFFFPRLGQGRDGGLLPRMVQRVIHNVEQKDPRQLPLISILIPMRNEAESIFSTVQKLLVQDDPRFELLVLDDESSDDSLAVARQAAGNDKRARFIKGKPLPEGWIGKNWACAQLAEAARGDILVFTDADVTWNPGALTALRKAMDNTQSDAYTVWPTQITVTWAERLAVPMMALSVLGYLPAPAVERTPFASLAAANGQCLAFRREAYAAIGGHGAVKNKIVEDVALARLIKRRNFHLRMADGNNLITGRMYRDWPSVRDGFAKNILAGHGGTLMLLLSALFHWLVFIFPPVWLIVGGLGGWNVRWPVWPLALWGAGLAVRALTAKITRQRAGDAFLMPVSVVVMTLITGQALRWHWRGGPEWKGRVYQKA